MPKRCCVPGCKGNYEAELRSTPYRSVFRFPKNEELKKKMGIRNFFKRKITTTEETTNPSKKMGLQPVHQVIPSTSTSSSLDQEDQGPDTTKADESNTLFGIRTMLTDKPVQDTQMLLNDDQSDSKDIGNFLNNSSSIPDKQKYDLLISPYRPPPTYDFKKDVESNKRPFIHKWLNQYDWLAYSKLLKGSFCKYCVIFPPTVNHGSALGAFITKPFLKYRDFHTQAKNHVNSAWHQDSAIRVRKQHGANKKITGGIPSTNTTIMEVGFIQHLKMGQVVISHDVHDIRTITEVFNIVAVIFIFHQIAKGREIYCTEVGGLYFTNRYRDPHLFMPRCQIPQFDLVRF
ncbi:unnamed protein product [Acanthoscelides obtectus]|uniref:TTF-type domain-containing protein n=1 Tax=Acanthoscelides obtectus TaxID=200917 RepID=A0A9P0LH70_ACAOB|nr:unnamed protein product [Acanthoscelides obtectus]CAK1649826.1 hypothetical protein AOBTE_LOCUS16451 [Acanthoscelides obtectus]